MSCNVQHLNNESEQWKVTTFLYRVKAFFTSHHCFNPIDLYVYSNDSYDERHMKNESDPNSVTRKFLFDLNTYVYINLIENRIKGHKFQS